jgi:iron complex transport system substrate-binding protein
MNSFRSGSLVGWILCLCFATGSGNAWAEETGSLIRIVSQTVGTDELLLAVAAPEQIVALSHLSRTKEFSAITKEAEDFPQLVFGGDAESILKHKPTLVLFTDFSRSELVAQVKRAGVQVLIFNKYMKLEDAYDNLRMLGKAIDKEAEARAEKVIAETQVRVASLQAKLKGKKTVRVLSPSTYGVIPGDDTTFQDLCNHAGGENLAFTLGKLRGHATAPSEKILTWPVEKLVLAGNDQTGDAAISQTEIDTAIAPFASLTPYKYMRSVKEKQVVLLKPWQMGCFSHYRVEAYEQLARQLHPDRF